MFVTLIAQSVEIPKNASFVEWLLGFVVIAVVSALVYIVKFWLPSLQTDFKAECKEGRELFERQIKAERDMWSSELDKSRVHQEKIVDKVCEQFSGAVLKFSQTDKEHSDMIHDLQTQIKGQKQ